MKKILMGLVLWLISPLIFAFSQADLVAQLQAPNSVQGHFTQQRFLKSLANPIVTSGKFTLLKNQGLLWQMQKPFSSDMRVKLNGIAQWDGSEWKPNNKLGQSQQISLFLGLFSGDLSALEQQFSLGLSGKSEDWLLQLTPDSLLMKQIFEKIQIRGDQVVKSIELREKQGDRVLISFEEVLLDQAVSDFAKQALQ